MTQGAVPAGIKSRRPRWTPSETAKALLETIFLADSFPSFAVRTQLAEQLGIDARQVQIWFQNRRQRERCKVDARSPADADADAETASAEQRAARQRIVQSLITEMELPGVANAPSPSGGLTGDSPPFSLSSSPPSPTPLPPCFLLPPPPLRRPPRSPPLLAPRPSSSPPTLSTCPPPP